MSGKRALVVENDRTFQRIVAHVLGKLGFTVSTADDGEEGLARIREQSPALVMLDLEMPVKDGLQMLADLKASGAKTPYVIILSAHESGEKHARAKELGAREVFLKPFNPADLSKRITALLDEGAL